MTREPALLKKLCTAVREGANVENCCSLFSAVDTLQARDLEEENGPCREGGEEEEEVHTLFTMFSDSPIILIH